MPIPSQNNKLERTTARERVYRTLRQWIIDGTLLPGERLSDAELAGHFSVSRTPVREALQQLAEQKLVYMVPSSGTYVSDIDLKDMVQVYEMLGGLQSFAASLSITAMDSSVMEELVKLNEKFLYHMTYGTPVEAMEADRSFHMLLAEQSGNDYLIKYTDQLITQAHRNEIRFFTESTDPRVSYQGHLDIIEALRAKDLEKAQSALKANWQISLETQKLMSSSSSSGTC